MNVVMPQMGESIAEGTITRWIKNVGDRVERDEPLFEISTDKVDAEIPSPAAGVLKKILVKESETVEVNTVVAEIDDRNGSVETVEPPRAADRPSRNQAATQSAGAIPESEAVRSEASALTEAPVRSSPLVRRMAREHHIDLSRVQGTGAGGRVGKKDILAYLAGGQEGARIEASTPGDPAAAAPAYTESTRVVPMTVMRRQIAERMVASKRTSAHVATVFEVEMTRVAALMIRCGAEFEKRHGMKLTYTPFFVRATVEALKRFPVLNSSLDGDKIVYKQRVNIGIAVALETGLIVPVIKHADEKNFLGVARAVRDLADRARSKHLSVDDVQEGTFTISNHGVFGSLIGTPIINQPQVAILGVGAIEKRPVVRDDALAIRTMVYLTLSFDHRVLDGAIADQFMGTLKRTLENWDESVL